MKLKNRQKKNLWDKSQDSSYLWGEGDDRMGEPEGFGADNIPFPHLGGFTLWKAIMLCTYDSCAFLSVCFTFNKKVKHVKQVNYWVMNFMHEVSPRPFLVL